jgi:hypothetical protein
MTSSDLSDEDIRARAYRLWQAAGEPYGDEDRFWHEARKQLLAEKGDVPPGMTDNLPV